MTLAMVRERRQQLAQYLRQQADSSAHDTVLIAGNVELPSLPFLQESTMYYLTGCQEPATLLTITRDGITTLYVPNTGGARATWLADTVEPTTQQAEELGVDAIRYLGAPIQGYSMPLIASQPAYSTLIADLTAALQAGGKLYTPWSQDAKNYPLQRVLLQQLMQWIPSLLPALRDITAVIAAMRRNKAEEEVEVIYNAGQCTILAQQAAARAIKVGMTEYQVQAAAEYIMVAHGARPAFDSIVAAGEHSTILHYQPGPYELRHGELVVVDIGARYEQYCADLTRTYPASGFFSDRQLKVYQHVLDCQDYIANIVRPGMYLKNPHQPTQSLHHLAKEYFAELGVDQYFTHGIGHYLGLDVHDVGDYTTPLQPGDVFTIEPGIYIPAEQCGIRIEDNYWLHDDGAVCLSQDLPKNPEEIEEMVREQF
ncbi:aminopeptidase P N-terminal domain-containing protein [Candidatus Dependentiae bacterium]|nr:aminopeptidase P N-terminal domain-containing protein [Candidatus Dependentiae bacterium]